MINLINKGGKQTKKKNVGVVPQGDPRNKGITLIALIITIIILLILSVVTIKITLNGGIIKHAENAVGDYNVEQWLASKSVQGYSDFALFFVCSLNNSGFIYPQTLYGSYLGTKNYPCYIRPVVTLQSDIQLEKNSNDVWQIK